MIEQQDAAPARGAAGRGQNKKDVQRRQANLLKSQCPCDNYAVKSLYTTYVQVSSSSPYASILKTQCPSINYACQLTVY
jgi:hypothetical protein